MKTETKTKDGKTKTEIKKTTEYPDGTKITIKTKTEVENGEEQGSYSIKVKGAEVETKLSVKSKTNGNQTKLKAKLSTGIEQEIIIMPDEALETALEELKTTHRFTFQITENTEGDNKKAVFQARAAKPGKLLGIFNVDVDLETLIDTETGEVIRTNSFLVRGADKTEVCHISGENSDKRITIEVAIPAVKAHLAHGDELGECMDVCGDGILTGTEVCEGDTKDCITSEGYAGTETCNADCEGYDSCISTESCGDNTINGEEECDDGNVLDGDGCDSLCKLEISSEPEPPLTESSSLV